MDLGSLLSAPPQADKPAWIDPSLGSGRADQSDFRGLSEGDLINERLQRESQNGFVARLRKGDVGVSDIPLASTAGSGMERLVSFLFLPLRLVLSNLGKLAALAMLLVGLGAATMAVMRVFEWALYVDL